MKQNIPLETIANHFIRLTNLPSSTCYAVVNRQKILIRYKWGVVADILKALEYIPVKGKNGIPYLIAIINRECEKRGAINQLQKAENLFEGIGGAR